MTNVNSGKNPTARSKTNKVSGSKARKFLEQFVYDVGYNSPVKTKIEQVKINGKKIPKYINEFWTSKQRQAVSLHEISYRACFKPQLPRFFIELLTEPGDVVYDPFSGRGTTILEAALLKRNVIANDVNPLSAVISKPRLNVPDVSELKKRLDQIKLDTKRKADKDLSMFYHRKTEAEIVNLKNYLSRRKRQKSEDAIDSWIRMVATNRLTGHSKNFFSVYTLPPNQAAGPESQLKINLKRKQSPVYKNVKEIILKKSLDLIKGINPTTRESLTEVSKKASFISKDAGKTKQIPDKSVNLTVTSPPFLNVVQYASDNWLRCWFNEIDVQKVSKKITMAKKLDEWCDIMQGVFYELFRITKPGGWVAFEVGEVNNGKIKLDEHVVPLGVNAGFKCECIVINEQRFTKTSNIWGVKNNSKGTNSNRIVLFNKC